MLLSSPAGPGRAGWLAPSVRHLSAGERVVQQLLDLTSRLISPMQHANDAVAVM